MTTGLRIVHTVDRYPPAVTGSSVYIQRLSEELVKRGHQVTVITSDAAGRLERKERLPAGSSLVNGVKVVRLPLTLSRVSLLQKVERTLYWRMAGLGKALRRPALWGLMQDPLGWKLLRCLLKEQCDILHTTPVTRSSIAATGMAARRINVPAVTTPFYHYSTDQFSRDDARWAVILKGFDLVLACTSAEARYLEKIGVPQERLRILGAGVDTLAYRQTTPGHWKARLNIGQEEFSALFMSTSLSTGKGADQVAQASLALPEVHFIFAGGSNAEWQDLAARVRPGANCHYVGFVDGTEKHQLFKAADLFVMPSVNDAFGIVYLEAMAAGKPVITANIDSMREVAGDAGLSVAHGDAEALVRAIRRFQQDQGLYRRCQEAAIRRAESCSWENLSARLENIYLELLEKRGLKRAYVAEKHV